MGPAAQSSRADVSGNRRAEMTLESYLKGNSYPGRFLLAGNTLDGEIIAAYAIMGRSANSRNRIFSLENGVLKTLPFDESKVEDPSLIIYNAGLTAEGHFILTNGDQTDTIKETLEEGKSLAEALSKRTYEPDSPNYTSRISALFNLEKKRASLSIIRKRGEETERIIWDYPTTRGSAHVIHTYEGDGNPLPAFSGDPKQFAVPSDLKELSELLWSSLNEENRISLYVRVGSEEIIINRNEVV